MSESLSDRLRSLGVQIGAQNIIPRLKPEKHTFPIEQILPGRYLTNIYGKAYAVEAQYELDYVHGCVAFSDPVELAMMSQWSQIPSLVNKNLNEIIFLDTETSGLAGGTGTYAFMIGLGAWTNQGFRLTQLFMEDPAGEPAVIAALTELLAPYSVVVTFNGKAFDVPLLNTRHMLNGFSTPFTAMDHIDLLQLARRLWRNRLASRALGNLEVEILGLGRGQEEIPGWMIPDMYFNYLQTRDARPLSGVFYHNAYDILSLAALFQYTASLLNNPLQASEPQSLDLVAIAQLHEELGNRDHAVRLYTEALALGLPDPYEVQTLLRFALLFRRLGDWQHAVELWEKASQYKNCDSCVELAKFYEHQARDYAKALLWTTTATEYVDRSSLGRWAKQAILAELLHRRERLLKKQCGSPADPPSKSEMVE